MLDFIDKPGYIAKGGYQSEENKDGAYLLH